MNICLLFIEMNYVIECVTLVKKKLFFAQIEISYFVHFLSL